MNAPEAGAATVRSPWLRNLWLKRGEARRAEAARADSLALRAFLGSRLLIWGAALGTVAIFGQATLSKAINDPGAATAPFRAGWLNFLVAPAARWDSVWYLQIAHDGYFSRASSAFFPLYPLLIHFGSLVLGSELVVGTLISVVSLIIALRLLYRLTEAEIHDRAAAITVLLLAFFPTSFFLSAVYTESLFLALSLGAICAAREDRWALASVLAALGSATRVNGVLLIFPLAFIYLYGPRPRAAQAIAASWWRPRYRPSRSALWLLLVPAALLAYLAYLGIAHGAALAPFQVQAEFWRRTFSGPFGAAVVLLIRLPTDVHRFVSGHSLQFGGGDPISWTAHDLIDVAFLAFAVVGLVFSWRYVSKAVFIYGLVYLAYALSDPSKTEALQGFQRYLLLAFPLFMGWGGWLAERRAARYVTLAGSVLLLVVFSGLWGRWSFMG